MASSGKDRHGKTPLARTETPPAPERPPQAGLNQQKPGKFMQNPNSSRQRLKDLDSFVIRFLKERGVDAAHAYHSAPIEADGSERAFFRIGHENCGHTFVAVLNHPATPFLRRENRAYLNIGKHLRGKGVPVPEILKWDLEKGLFLVEDMGNLRLHDAPSGENRARAVREEVLSALLLMQVRGAVGFDPAWCCQTEQYDLECMRRHESGYFRDEFVSRYLGLDATRHTLDPAFDHLALSASKAGAPFFMHRDFQSRNILMGPGGPAFVDWQGGRLGPPGYDLASFLLDPYSGLSESARKGLYEFYLDKLRRHYPGEAERLQETYPYLAVQRNLQILGAFAFLTLVRRKPFFEAFIPAAGLSLLRSLLALKDPRLDNLTRLMESTRGVWGGE
jgi:N-acetylmuramate 1-kinase